MNLPTIEQCRTFLATINRGREAIGLEALEKLDFDACLPNNMCRCLSATHLFAPAGYLVMTDHIEATNVYRPGRDVGRALGMERYELDWRLPADILAVTDVFDACEDNPELLKALRERMVEAGVV